MSFLFRDLHRYHQHIGLFNGHDLTEHKIWAIEVECQNLGMRLFVSRLTLRKHQQVGLSDSQPCLHRPKEPALSRVATAGTCLLLFNTLRQAIINNLAGSPARATEILQPVLLK